MMKKEGRSGFSVCLGNYLQIKRAAKGESLRVAAQNVGISKSALFYYETGDASISASSLLKLCNYYGTTLADVQRWLESNDY